MPPARVEHSGTLWGRVRSRSLARLKTVTLCVSYGCRKSANSTCRRALDQPTPAWCASSACCRGATARLREHCRLSTGGVAVKSAVSHVLVNKLVRVFVIQYVFRPRSSSARPSALNMGPVQATREAACARRSLGALRHSQRHKVTGQARPQRPPASALCWFYFTRLHIARSERSPKMGTSRNP